MKTRGRLRGLLDGFYINGKLSPALVLLALAVNTLVGINSYSHNPKVGYDALDHIAYIGALPDRLPNASDTHEFFSPPLPYFLPSLFRKACTVIYGGEITNPNNPIRGCSFHAARFAQWLNLLLSILLTLVLLKAASRIAEDSFAIRFSSLLVLGSLPVYYKTMAQVRGEPYVALFSVLSIYLLFSLMRPSEEFHPRHGLLLGVSLGCLALSRQWGFFLFPAIALCVAILLWVRHPAGWAIARIGAISFGIAALVAGWFYLHLFFTYGSFTAFNMQATGFSFSNQPHSFYRHTHIEDGLLFTSPVRPTFDNQFFPIFYSDTWGDYWGFFTFIKENSQYGLEGHANEAWIVPYLARVNQIALIPSLLLVVGFLTGIWKFARATITRECNDTALKLALLSLFVATSMTGFLWFLISYPELKDGSTIKATYMIQVFVTLPLLAGYVLHRIEQFSRKGFALLIVVLIAIWIHNLSAMLTQYEVFLGQ